MNNIAKYFLIVMAVNAFMEWIEDIRRTNSEMDEIIKIRKCKNGQES